MESIYQQQEELAASQRGGTFVCTEDDTLALAVSQRPLPDGGWIATYEDVTERQQTETRIRFLAHHDALTNLPNRVLFRNKISDALSQLTEDGNDLALLYLDLDRFKLINDTLGHPAGDALLEVAARRLQGCIRSTDFVARLGGDEFAVLYPSRDLPGAATAQAQRIIELLERALSTWPSQGRDRSQHRHSDCRWPEHQWRYATKKRRHGALPGEGERKRCVLCF